jgi:hypothetical protein
LFGWALQSIIDPFVRAVGGELVEEILGTAPDLSKSADYLFRKAGVIAELKSLEQSSFGPAFENKMTGLLESWADRGLVLIYGTQRVDLAQLPEPCQREVLNVLSKPLKNNVLRQANQQIRQTKQLLNLSGARGLLMVASDGNEDLHPPDLMFFFSRLLSNNPSNDTAEFSSIDAVPYFNPRMPARLPTRGQLALIWATILRKEDDRAMVGFLDELSNLFKTYMEKTFATSFHNLTGDQMPHRDLRFAGVPQRVPEIDLSKPSSKQKP